MVLNGVIVRWVRVTKLRAIKEKRAGAAGRGDGPGTPADDAPEDVAVVEDGEGWAFMDQQLLQVVKAVFLCSLFFGRRETFPESLSL